MTTPPFAERRPVLARPMERRVTRRPPVRDVLGPAVAVGLSGALFGIYAALAARSLGVRDLAAAAIVPAVAAGVVLLWLAAARQPLPLLAFLPAGVLAPEFVFGHPGAVRIAIVMGSCLALFALLRAHLAGRTAGVPLWIERHAGWLAAVVIGVHLVATTILVVARHHYYGSVLGEDTAYYNQIFWSTLHGDFFRGSLTQARYSDPPIHSEFGAHSSPVLFLLLPAYWAHPSFYTLLALRNAALSASAVPLYFLAKGKLGGAVGLGVVVVHLLGPNLLHQSVSAFYPMQFAILFLPLAFVFFDRARFPLFLASYVLALSVREEIALTLVLFSAYALVLRRSWRWVITPAFIGGAWWYVSTRFVMVPSRIAMEDLDEFFRAFPDGFRGAVAAVLQHPVELLGRMLTTDNVAYVYQLVKSTTGVALATPAIVFAVPTALINVVVGAFWKTTTSIAMHYSVVVAVCLSVALVYGLARLATWHRFFRTNERALAAALVLMLAPQVLLGVKDVVAYGGGTHTLVDEFRPRSDDGTLRRILRTIDRDPEAAVAAPNVLLPQLSTRRALYNTSRLWWYGEPRLDYIVLDTNLERAARGERSQAKYASVVAAVREDRTYDLILREADFELYAKTGRSR